MEIIKLLGNFNKKSSIYENFLTEMMRICPYLEDKKIDQNEENILYNLDTNKNLTFLELNSYQLKSLYSKKQSEDLRIISIESLIENYLNIGNSEEDIIKLDLEALINDIVYK